jgi:hypothetical protein
MFKATLFSEYKTNYKLILIDDATNKIKQVAETHNVFLHNWWNSGPNQYCGNRLVEAIHLGSGSGTPSVADSNLFSYLWGLAASETQTTDLEHHRITFIATATFPATASYVGTVTEIGCSSRATATNNNQGVPLYILMFTHALLKDAEGNPMSIVKTDTDRLIVTTTIEVSYSTSAPFNLVKRPGYIGRHNAGGNWAISQWYGVRLLLGTTKPDAMCYRDVWAGSYITFRGPSADTSCTPLTMGSLDKSTLKMSFANTRIAQTIGQNRPIYYNYIIFEGFVYAVLPDPTVFAYYNIEGIEIGTGDGNTSVFTNPLDYFVKDSEIVYKNGVALTRNVDYTIDYRNNHRRLPELAATKNCKLSGGFTIDAGSYASYGPTRQLFQRFINELHNYSCEILHTGWLASAPLIIELEDADEVNTFFVPAWIIAGTITLSCSNDGDTWTQVDQFVHNTNQSDLRSFSSVIAKYWKIEGTNTSWNGRALESDDMSIELFLGYVGDAYIRFTTPPAEGDEITMKVQMDRPFKNGNFVIDVSAELQLG